MISLSKYLDSIKHLTSQALVQRMVGMIVGVFLARLLGPASYGIYNVVITLSESFCQYSKLGVDTALHVYTAESRTNEKLDEKVANALGTSFVFFSTCGLVGSTCMFFTAEYLSIKIYNNVGLIYWIKLGSLLVFFQCIYYFFYAALVGLHQFKNFARLIIYISIFSAASLFWFTLHFGLKGAVVTYLLTQFVVVSFMGFLLARSIWNKGLTARFQYSIQSLVELVKIGMPMYLASVVSIPVYIVLQGLLTSNYGVESLAYFRVIVALTVLVSFVPSSINAAMISKFTNARVENTGSEINEVLQNLRMIWLLSFLGAGVLFLIIEHLIELLFGEEYSGLAFSARIAIVTSQVICVTNIATNYFISIRRTDLLMYLTVFNMSIFALFGYFFVPLGGLAGYIFSELAGVLVSGLVLYGACIRLVQRNGIYIRSINHMLFASAVYFLIMFAILSQVHDEILQLGVGALCFSLVVAYCFKNVLLEDERRSLIRILDPTRQR